jgi:ribokinase
MPVHCVLGSLNMDMVTRVRRFVRPGETIKGLSFEIFPGGKGGNQAVALAKIGAKVEMVGALGDDPLGRRYAELLRELGIVLEGLRLERESSTGTAAIEVTEAGENRIVVVPGANDCVDPASVEASRPIIERCSTLLLQLEIPLDSVLAAARIASAKGKIVVLDPAPAADLPRELFPLVSVITPNEGEASALTGEDTSSEEGIARAARALLSLGVGAVIVKAGARGAYFAKSGEFRRASGFEVEVVDTVAAGDSFNADLAWALGEGKSFDEALVFANAVAALSTTKEGAQSAMPSLEQTEGLIRSAKRTRKRY